MTTEKMKVTNTRLIDTVRKFGTGHPWMEDCCNECGQRYGIHDGAACPNKPSGTEFRCPLITHCDEGLVYITEELRKALDLALRGIPFRVVENSPDKEGKQ